VAKATSPVPVPTDPVELLSTPLARSGLAAGATLRRAGIKLDFYTVRDLLFHLPRRYDDLREMRHLGDLVWERDGTVVSAQARVGDVRVEPGFRGRTQRTIARLEDDTGSIDATWFGRRFIERRLAVGAEVVVSGKVKHFGRRLTLDNPEFQVVADDTELLHAGRIVPVYPLTAGLTSIRLRAAIREALDKAGYAYPEYLPPPIITEVGLVPIVRAIEEAHYPDSFEGRDAALRRLAFDELLALQLGMVGRRRQRGRDAAEAIEVDAANQTLRASVVASIRRKLADDVDLTEDQDAAIDAIRSDLARPTPMLRLLQGDVGSGKTVIALAAALMAVERHMRGRNCPLYARGTAVPRVVRASSFHFSSVNPASSTASLNCSPLRRRPAESTLAEPSFSRHRPMASKFSRPKPMGSICAWQEAQVGSWR
jgi:ATP-dependent DNA helicase RecG